MANGQCIATTQAMYSVAASAESLETTVAVLTGLTVFLVLMCAATAIVAVRLGSTVKRLNTQHDTPLATTEKEF
ncbi:hypothetical protein OG302_29470 [Streptomyces sp. NBC_01283]|uniref:hypothetical protein n=1 Tax=Streptomyces sp. NBC_01283 TaxID=2903812 RepID=UPI00352EB425|nr:hypothetical protein OG302_29470 [Streptomyces sp. NBC_01283]